jgi:hypothetical protein
MKLKKIRLKTLLYDKKYKKKWFTINLILNDKIK